jgi:hypothetical protein
MLADDDSAQERDQGFSPTRFSESALSIDQVKTAIVQILEARPKHSCKRNALARLVLRHLGMRLRGRARRPFCVMVRTCVTYLARVNIISLYVAKNKRVRLTPNYQERFKRLQARMVRRSSPLVIPQDSPLFAQREGEGPAGSVADEPDNLGDQGHHSSLDVLRRVGELPELPDDLDYNAAERRTAACSPATRSAPGEDEPPDDETERLMGVLR